MAATWSGFGDVIVDLLRQSSLETKREMAVGGSGFVFDGGGAPIDGCSRRRVDGAWLARIDLSGDGGEGRRHWRRRVLFSMVDG